MKKYSILILLLFWLIESAKAGLPIEHHDTSTTATWEAAFFLPPTAVALDDSTIAENEDVGTLVGIFSTTDPDTGTGFVYTLTEGEGDEDNASFAIAGDSLLANAVFDYEADSTYTIRVTTTDPEGDFFASTFIITVADVNDPPTNILLDKSSVAENLPVNSPVGMLSTTDADDAEEFTYELVEGDSATDNGSFTIVGDQLLSAEVFDFETKSEYLVRIQTTDSQDSVFAKAFAITIEDVADQPPTNIQLDNASIAENLSADAPVGTLSTVDADNTEGFTYALIEGDSAADNGSFAIAGDQLRSAETFDFETKSEYLIRIQTTDLQGSTFAKAFVITITDEDETPNLPPTDITLDDASIAENQPEGTPVGRFFTADPDDGSDFTYTMVAGEGDDDNPAFRISGNQLLSDEEFDFETKDTYRVRVQTTDSQGNTFAKAFIITIEDVDENTNQPPTDITLDNTTIAENESEGSLVGKLFTTDLDDNADFTYTLTEGEGDEDNASFSIKNNQLLSAEVFDFETKNTYQVRITTTDPLGAAFAKAFTIQIMDVDEIDNQAPTDLVLSNNSIAENEPVNTEMGFFDVIDADTEDTHTVTLVEGEGDDDNGRFQIRDNTLYTLVSFDFEKRNMYSIRVQGKDPKEATVTKVFTILVTDVEDNNNQDPTDIYLSDTVVNEGQITNLVVGILSATDPNPGDTHTFSLVPGAGDPDNAIFTIAGNQLLTAQVFDYETQDRYRIRVRADDGRGGMLEKPFAITVVGNENNTPEIATPLADLTAEVGEPFSFTLPTTTFEDADADDVLTYAFTLEGAPLPDWLTFDATTQTLSGTPPQDAPDSLVLVVTATDPQDASVSEQFTLTITRVTAVEDEIAAAWTVYPVPSDQRYLTIRTPSWQRSDTRLRLLDVSGQVVRSYSIGAGHPAEYTIELPAGLSSGTYFLEIRTSAWVGRKRIMLY